MGAGSKTQGRVIPEHELSGELDDERAFEGTAVDPGTGHGTDVFEVVENHEQSGSSGREPPEPNVAREIATSVIVLNQ